MLGELRSNVPQTMGLWQFHQALEHQSRSSKASHATTEKKINKFLESPKQRSLTPGGIGCWDICPQHGSRGSTVCSELSPKPSDQ